MPDPCPPDPTSAPADPPGGADQPLAVVDGGEEPWSRLRAALERRRAALPPGALLEVSTSHPEAVCAVPAWCARNGDRLTRTHDGDAVARFVIRIGAHPEPGSAGQALSRDPHE
ncbi:sulfurtransferase TusA family protein [Streptomyces sp. NBC_00669]|uniref:sulfurtransferase TusA family protein n=1 Tax=unclassified Streptomyces TaxID=2593676 RepID=UPI002E31F78C|nr:sulfurtransferase TusA family protein [Streptomyces sp. NBC_00669]